MSPQQPPPPPQHHHLPLPCIQHYPILNTPLPPIPSTDLSPNPKHDPRFSPPPPLPPPGPTSISSCFLPLYHCLNGLQCRHDDCWLREGRQVSMSWKGALQSPCQQAVKCSSPPTPSHTQLCASTSTPPRCVTLPNMPSLQVVVCCLPQCSFHLHLLWLACHCNHDKRAGRTSGAPCLASGLLTSCYPFARCYLQPNCYRSLSSFKAPTGASSSAVLWLMPKVGMSICLVMMLFWSCFVQKSLQLQ